MKAADLRVTLVYSSAPRTVHEEAVTVPAGTTVRDALAQAGWLVRFPEIPAQTLGIWGRVVGPQAVLRDGDRVEVYRALRVDPKVARRERFVGQGARGTGLFNRRRPGSKAGY
ncbi:MAG: RnfH family protein [Hydrogenophaga sp.]|nr:RnfH family protein [Hydrogenophaga sp.]